MDLAQEHSCQIVRQAFVDRLSGGLWAMVYRYEHTPPGLYAPTRTRAKKGPGPDESRVRMYASGAFRRPRPLTPTATTPSGPRPGWPRA